MILTNERVAELCARSANGEGVRAVLASFGCDDEATMEWLRDNHHASLKAAKAAFAAVPEKVASRRAVYLDEIERADLARAAEKVVEIIGPVEDKRAFI